MNRSISLQICSTGAFVPPTTIPSTVFDQRFGKPTGWSEQRFKIKNRPMATMEKSSEMAARAARDALEKAGKSALELDLVVSASSIMEQPIPTMGVLIQRQLGLGKHATPVLDVNATCLGFLTALDTVSYAIDAGRYRNVLIVCSEMPSRGLNWRDPEASVIFGDGAAAAIVSRSNGSGSKVLAAHFETHSDAVESCKMRSGGTGIDPRENTEAFLDGAVFEMDGLAAYRATANAIGPFLDKLMQKAGLTISDIDLVVPHQASALALHHLRRRLGIGEEQIVDIFVDHGNQVSCSIPMALHHGIECDRLERGDRVLLIGTSAGISIGGVILEY